MSLFYEIKDCIYDIGIINKQLAICSGTEKKVRFFAGLIEKIIFSSDSWMTTIMCCLENGQKVIYSLILNRTLVRKLQLLGKLNNINHKEIVNVIM